MIVILKEERISERDVYPGDTFQLTHTKTYLGKKVSEKTLISETVNKFVTINYVCSFVFADENGYVSGGHINGFFGNYEELPDEIEYAKRVHQLSPEQLQVFIKSVPVDIDVGERYETN